MKTLKDRKCLVPTCDNMQTRRGLCVACRIAAKREIESGGTTEAELIESGLLLPKVRRGKLVNALELSRNEKTEVSNGKRKRKCVKQAK